MIEFNQDLALQLLESEVEYPVNLDDGYVWLGYTRKDSLKEKLVKHFEEGVDYIVAPAITGTVAVQGFENPRKESIFLTTDTFKELGMLAGTDKGKEVRKYFIKCEKLLKAKLKEEQFLITGQLALQLSSFIEEQRQTTKLLMERTNKLDAIEEAHTNNPGIKDVIDAELEHNYSDDVSFTVVEYLNHKGVNLDHAATLSKRAPQFVRCGSFGQPSRNSKSQFVYTGNQVNYLDCALRTILDI
jgi:phage anti-repressor protein